MSEKVVKGIHYAILTIIAIAFVLPLVWLILASLDTGANATLKLPDSWTLDNFVGVLTDKANLRAFGIGLAIAAIQSLMVVLVSGLAAYPLSRYNLRYKSGFLYGILFMTALPMIAVVVPVYKMFSSMGILDLAAYPLSRYNLRYKSGFLYGILFMTALPMIAVVVPVYKMFSSMGILDSIPGVILYLTASSLPYGIWLMKNFMDGVPKELEEAAWVDGATTMQSIRKIVAPLMFPGICVVFIYTFSGSWGNFFIPYILLSSPDKMPAAVQLYQFFGQHGMISYGPLAAYSIIYALPSVLLYILSQNYMSKGFTMAGAAKG